MTKLTGIAAKLQGLPLQKAPNRRLTIIGLSLIAVIMLGLNLTTKNISAAPWAPTAGNWLQRKQITLVNNSGATLHANTTYKISIDTAALYNSGLLVSTCDDLRVFYQPNDSTALELKRNLEYASGTTCATSTSTQIVFALQSDMANAANSSSYYIYYDNPDAPAYAAADALDAYNIGSKEATFVAPFNGTTTALAAGSGTPTTESGAIRYSGSKSALSFDGVNDYIQTINFSQTNPKTIEFWVNIPKNPNNDTYGINLVSMGGGSVSFHLSTGGQLGFRVTSGSEGWLDGYDISKNEWHHIAGICTTTGAYFFIDGIQKATSSYPCVSTSSTYYLGGTGAPWYTNSTVMIDEFRVSNSVRYTANFTPQTSPFVRDEYTKLLLHFDENGDDPRNTGKAIDDSGNGNHGTITGAKYVSGLIGSDAPQQGQTSIQGYASHQGVFIEEGTTNKITNPSFEHSTYNTNWAQPSVFDYDTSADTFTAGAAKRNSAGPFAAGVMAQGTSQGSASSGDVVTVSLGTTIASKFSSNLDADQGSIVLWWTPEFSDGDHGYSYLASAANGGIYLRYEYYYGGSPAYRFRFASGSTSSVYSKAITAGTTYCIVFRWDSKNTLDGTNYYSLSVDDVHAFSVSTPQTSTPTSPLYLGNWSTMQANGIIEGLTIYRRPLFDGTYGIDVGNGDEINQIWGGAIASSKDPTLVTGSWDVVFALPTNASTGALTTGTGNAWSHPHSSNLLYTSTTNTGGFMMNGTPATDGWTTTSDNWWLSGGISSSNVVAVYQPKGAASLAASYVNLANPGTNNLTPSATAPTWDTTNGWTLNGSSNYLTASGITDVKSMLCSFTATNNGILFNFTPEAYIWPNHAAPASEYYFNGYIRESAHTSGVIGYLNGSGAFYNGSITIPEAGGRTVGNLLIGGWTTSQYLLAGTIQGCVFYNNAPTLAQFQAVTTAMTNMNSVTISPLAVSEKIFAGGYKFTSTGANQGISRSFTATSGGDYVVRAIGHADANCQPQVKVVRADGTTEVTHLNGASNTTRTAPTVYIFTFESPAAETLNLQLLNLNSSGTCYWHQVEVLGNLLNNPSMETGSGDPWVPTGWSNYRSSVGQNGYSQTNYSSGNQSFKINVDDTNKGISISRAFTQGDFYGSGLWLKNDSGSSAILPINLSNNNPPTGGCMQNYSCTGWNDGYSSSSQTPKRIFGVSRVITTGTYGTYVMSSGGATVSYIDDVYLYSLNPVSLTVTPATEANSLEASGLRVDGTDTLTQTVDSLTVSSGKIKFKFTPRHNLAVADKFGSTFSNITIFDARADTVNNRIWITPISTTSVLLRGTFNGTVVDATWSSATLNTGTTYEAEINYTAGGSLNLKIDGVQVATNTGVVAFGTVPTTAYFGANYAGGWQYDATFTIPTFTGIVTPTENTTVPYYKFGSKSAKLVASADGQYVTSINPGNTNTHTLSAYVYDGTSGNVGGTVSATIAKLVYGSSTFLTTTYTDVGGGWWRLSYSGAVTNAAADYGIAVLSGKTVYVDGVQLEAAYYATTYADGTLGTGYAWTGTANNSTSTRIKGLLKYSATNNASNSSGTVSFWIKAPYVPAINSAFEVLDMGTAEIGNGLGIRIQNTNMRLWYHGNGPWAGGTITADKWNHIVLTWNSATTTVSLYRNLSASTYTDLPALTLDNYIGIGNRIANDGTQSDVNYSDFRIFNTNITSTEVADLYYAGLGSHSEQVISTERYTDGEPPVLAWHLDDPSTGSGQEVHDSTTYLNHGTISGATWSDDSIGGGPNSKSLKFDGVDDKISRTYSSDTELNPNTNAFSVSTWFKSPSTSSGQTRIILSRYSGSGYKLWMSATGTICFGVDDDSTWGPDDSTCTTTTYADSNWHQVLVVIARGVSPAAISIYIDATLAASNNSLTITGSLSGSNPTLYVGIDSDGTSNPWNGFIDEVRIYNSVRSEEQVNTEFVARGSNKGASVVLGAQQSEALSEGLVGYWKMDEASWNGTPNEVIDSSSNGNHGVRVADAATASGKFGNGGTFDGTGDYVNCGTGSSITSVTQFTVGGWVKTTNSGVNPFISFGELAPSLRIAHYGTRALIYLGSSNYRYFDNSPTNIFDNNWHYVAFVITGNGQDDIDNSKMYVDGKEQTINLTYKVGSPEAKSFCKIAYNSQGDYTGSLDEIRVYNRALSATEVRALYEFAPGPVAHWNMDEGTGQSANDISGNNNTGTLGANSSPGSDDPTWTNGKYGKALSFDGSNDYVSTSSFSSITGTMTMSAWVKRNTNTDMAIWGTDYGGTRATIYSGNLYISLKIGGTLRNLTLNANTYIPSGTWHYITMTYDGNTLSAFVDGIRITSLDVSGSITNAGDEFDPNDKIDIGHGEAWGQKYMNGLIDDVRIYNYARTTKQIVQDMNAGHPAVGSPVGSAVAYYKFNEGQGITANNSGNGGSSLNGTLTNMSSPATSTSGWTNNGKLGKSIVYDGSNDYINGVTNSVFQNADNHTVTAWVKSTKTGWQFIGGYYSFAAQDDGYALVINTSGTFGFIEAAHTNWAYATSSGTYAGDNLWHHLVGVRRNGTAYIYVDGVVQPNTTTLTPTFVSPKLLIGWQGATGQSFGGSIDEVKIYNYALSEDEVKLEYNQGKSIVMGSTGTTATGTADNSASRAYCPPGNVEGNCANGLNPAPVAEWNLDEGTGTSVADSSGNANTGTWYGSGTHWTSGKVGKSGKFNGSDDWILVNDAVTLRITSKITLETWVNVSQYNANGSCILAKRRYLTTPYWYPENYSLWVNADGTITFEHYNGGFRSYLDNSSAIPLNQWIHLSLVYDETTSSVKFYRNGVLTKTLSTISTLLSNDTEALFVGNYPVAQAQQNQYGLYGAIDTIRIYNYARSIGQVAWDYNQGAPMAWYKLDECSGNTVHSQNETYDANLNGTINIGATLPQSSAGTCGSGVSTEAWNNGTSGKFNGSLNFDGVDDYVGVSESYFDYERTQPFGSCAWIKPTNITDVSHTIVSKMLGSAPITGWEFTAYDGGSASDGLLVYLISSWPNNRITVSKDNIINANEWQHVCFTYDGSSSASGVRIYKNGVNQSAGINTDALTSSILNNQALNIGVRANTLYHFNGQIDDVRIYNYALTEKQVEDVYNGGVVRYGN